MRASHSFQTLSLVLSIWPTVGLAQLGWAPTGSVTSHLTSASSSLTGISPTSTSSHIRSSLTNGWGWNSTSSTLSSRYSSVPSGGIIPPPPPGLPSSDSSSASSASSSASSLTSTLGSSSRSITTGSVTETSRTHSASVTSSSQHTTHTPSSASATVTSTPNNGGVFAPAVIWVTSTVNSNPVVMAIVSGGAITSPISVTPTGAVTTGPVALASISSFSSQAAEVSPLVRAWIDDPESSEKEKDSLDALGVVIPFAAGFLVNFGGNALTGSKPCPGGSAMRRDLAERGLFSLIGDAFGCITNSLGKIGTLLAGASLLPKPKLDELKKLLGGELLNLMSQLDSLNDKDLLPSGPGSQPSPTGNEGQSSLTSSSPTMTGITSTTSSLTSMSTTLTTSTTSSSSTMSCSSASNTCRTIFDVAPTGSASSSCRTTCVALPSRSLGPGENDACEPTKEPMYCSYDCPHCSPRPNTQLSRKSDRGIFQMIWGSLSSRLYGRSRFNKTSPLDISDISASHISTNLTKRVFKDPSAYNGLTDFFFDELKRSRLVPHGRGIVNGQDVGKPAAIHTLFEDKQVSLGVVNLYGCTSVIVVSSKGAWISHYWESPLFFNSAPTPPDKQSMLFRQGVTLPLLFGCDFEDRSRNEYHDEGLSHFSSDVPANSPGMFASQFSPRAIIITPSTRLGDPTQIAYPDQIQNVRQALESVMDGVQIDVSLYAPRFEDLWISDPSKIDNDIGDPYGKAFLRYDPGVSGCQGEPSATVEVWHELKRTPIFSSVWAASTNQIVSSAINARDVACPITTSSTTPTSLSSALTSVTTQLSSLVTTTTVSSSSATTTVITTSSETSPTSLISPTSSAVVTSEPVVPVAPPAPSPTPYTPGTCKISLWQQAQGPDSPVTLSVQIYDGSGAFSGGRNFPALRWGQMVTIPAFISNLPYDIDVELTTIAPDKGWWLPPWLDPDRLVPDWLKWDVRVNAGGTKWSYNTVGNGELPRCEIQGWTDVVDDNLWSILFPPIVEGLPNRVAHCYWSC